MKKVLKGTVGLALTLGLMACGGQSGPGASHLRVFNGAPALPSADIWVDNAAVAENLPYSGETPYLPVDSGNLNIQVNAADGGALLNISPTLEEGADYTLIVLSGASSFETILMKDDNTPPPSGMGKMQVVHGAPAADEVDIYVTAPGSDLNGEAPALTNLAFKEVSESIELNQGSYQIRVTAPGVKTPVLLDLGISQLNEGDIETVIIMDSPPGG